MKRKLMLIVLDVDGTMTDSGIYYDNNGNEYKKFSTKDAAGFFAAHEVGMKIIVLTGRECLATTRRMAELKVDFLKQNCKDKTYFLKEYMSDNHYDKEEVAYIGDDLNDIAPMSICGYVGCPSDSCQEVKAIADYVSPIQGGHGAVRDIIEHILRESGEWEKAVSKAYSIGI